MWRKRRRDNSERKRAGTNKRRKSKVNRNEGGGKGREERGLVSKKQKNERVLKFTSRNRNSK